MSKILVTGCTGLVGRGITNHFLSKGFEVWGTHPQPFKSMHKNFHSIVLELKNTESIEHLFSEVKDIDLFIHNAAYVPKNSSENDINNEDIFDSNFIGTKNLLKFFHKSNYKKFIFISGTALVNNNSQILNENLDYNPKNSYLTSKILAEILCNQYIIEKKSDIKIFRTSGPYGYATGLNSVIPTFINLVKNSSDITLWGTGTREQVFTFVDDIGYACELSLNNNSSGIFNITGSSSITMKDLASEILNLFPESKSKIIFTGDIDPQEGRSIKISCEKARNEIGYIPQFSISEGLTEMIKRNNSNDFFEITDK